MSLFLPPSLPPYLRCVRLAHYHPSLLFEQAHERRGGRRGNSSSSSSKNRAATRKADASYGCHVLREGGREGGRGDWVRRCKE